MAARELSWAETFEVIGCLFLLAHRNCEGFIGWLYTQPVRMGQLKYAEFVYKILIRAHLD